jgi:hypothetical protein
MQPGLGVAWRSILEWLRHLQQVQLRWSLTLILNRQGPLAEPQQALIIDSRNRSLASGPPSRRKQRFNRVQLSFSLTLILN